MREIPISGIKAEVVSSWLADAGWTRRGLGKRSVELWQRFDQRVLLPTDRLAPDYEARLAEAVNMISRVVGVPPESLSNLMLLYSSDAVEWHFSGDGSGDGHVMLGPGTAYLDGIRRAYISAASSTIFRRGYFGRRIPKGARQFADGVRLAPTRPGSYVFPTSVAVRGAALPPSISLDMEVQTVPFERRVLELLFDALGTIQRLASEEYMPTRLDAVELVGSGISYELCGAIGSMLDTESERQIEIAFDFNRRIRTDRSARMVRLTTDARRTIDGIRQSLFESGVTSTQMFVVNVASLRRNDRLGDSGGVINVKTAGDASAQLLRVELPEEFYLAAVRAHELNQPLEIVGQLVEHTGRRARIENVQSVARRVQGMWADL